MRRLALIALLVALLLPSLSGAREHAKATQCRGMMRGIGVGIATYAADFNNSVARCVVEPLPAVA